MQLFSENQFREKVVPRLKSVRVPLGEGEKAPLLNRIVHALLIVLFFPIALVLMYLGRISWQPRSKVIRLPHGIENLLVAIDGVHVINRGCTFKFCEITRVQVLAPPVGGDNEMYPRHVQVAATCEVRPGGPYRAYGLLSVNGQFNFVVNKLEPLTRSAEISCAA